MIGDISDQNYPANLWVRDDGMTGEPTYWSRPTDPEFTIRCTEPWGDLQHRGNEGEDPSRRQDGTPDRSAPHGNRPSYGPGVQVLGVEQTTLTDAEIAALRQTNGTAVPAWRKRIYRAMAKYGMFFGDTGAGGYFQIEHESGAQYTSVGRTDAWRSLVQSNGWPRDADNTGYVGFFRYDDVDWANRLRVIAPCVSQRTC